MKHSFTFNFNSIRLSVVEWVIAMLMVGVMFVFMPAFWESREEVVFGRNYRVPYEMSNNYWFISRWVREASGEKPVVIIGDSVVWGHYTDLGGVLSAHLNRLSRGNSFANLGIDGLHPAAMPGFFKHYAGALKEHHVILHLNLLWMSSKQHDLSVEEEFRFNHPRLVPQVHPGIACYNPSLSEIIGVSAERAIPFISWTQHLRQTYFENMDLINWTLMNPLENPLNAVDFKVPEPEDRPRSRPRPWMEAGIPGEQELPWVEKKDSFQWMSFKNAIEVLERRNNHVFVVIGPFNEHMLSAASRARHEKLLAEVKLWLEESGIPRHRFSLLPAELFADASHPVDEGYRLMAEELKENEEFKLWLGEVVSD